MLKLVTFCPLQNGQVVGSKVGGVLSKHSVAFLKATLRRKGQSHIDVPNRTEVVLDQMYLFSSRIALFCCSLLNRGLNYFICMDTDCVLNTADRSGNDHRLKISERRHFPSPPSSHFSFVVLSPKP